MEPKFSSSFIPQRPMQAPVARPASTSNRRPSAPIGFGYLVTLVLFFLAVLASGGVFFYAGYVEHQIDKLVEEIKSKKDQQPEITATLKRLDDRIETAKVLLSQHIALSSFFTVLEQTTLRPVQLTALSIARETEDTSSIKHVVSVEGLTLDLDTVAVQYTSVRDADGVEGLTVTDIDNNEPGKVMFTVMGGLDSRFITFERLIGDAENSDAVDAGADAEDTSAPSDSVVPEGEVVPTP